MRIRFTRKAAADLEEIYQYGLQHFGRAQADAYGNALAGVLNLLAENPAMARLHTEYAPPVHIHPWRSHFIVYVTQEGCILIVRFFHQSSDYVRHLTHMD